MVYNVLRQAILMRRTVRVFFQGYHRDVCPYVLGRKKGAQRVLAFECGDGSKSALPDGGQWRCMPVSEIASAELTDDAWPTSRPHKLVQTCVEQIEVQAGY